MNMKPKMSYYLILRRKGWRDADALGKAGAVSARVGTEEMADKVRWIRSYAVNEPDGRVGTVCLYEGIDEEAIREHARRAGMPADEVLPVGDTFVVNPDPESMTVSV